MNWLHHYGDWLVPLILGLPISVALIFFSVWLKSYSERFKRLEHSIIDIQIKISKMVLELAEKNVAHERDIESLWREMSDRKNLLEEHDRKITDLHLQIHTILNKISV